MISIFNSAAFKLYDVFGQFWDTVFSQQCKVMSYDLLQVNLFDEIEPVIL